MRSYDPYSPTCLSLYTRYHKLQGCSSSCMLTTMSEFCQGRIRSYGGDRVCLERDPSRMRGIGAIYTLTWSALHTGSLCGTVPTLQPHTSPSPAGPGLVLWRRQGMSYPCLVPLTPLAMLLCGQCVGEAGHLVHAPCCLPRSRVRREVIYALSSDRHKVNPA